MERLRTIDHLYRCLDYTWKCKSHRQRDKYEINKKVVGTCYCQIARRGAGIDLPLYLFLPARSLPQPQQMPVLFQPVNFVLIIGHDQPDPGPVFF